MFDIIIPTWNNLNMLKLTINSIELNSTFNHKIYIHINEGIDGTLEWVKSKGYLFTHFEKNKGVCEGTNLVASLGNNKNICYFNDDMVALPEWDLHLFNFINHLNKKKYFVCSTPIEPIGSNPNCIIKNYGSNPKNFNKQIYNDLESLRNIKSNLNSTWSPFIIPRNLWENVGGYSIEFEPGMGSDPDICKKIYDEGCRDFVGVGKSLIYHFVSKTTGRIRQNNSKAKFKEIHGISIDDFIRIIKRGKKYETIKD